MSSIVILEDDILSRLALGQSLSEAGFDVRTYSSTNTAFPELVVRPPDILIADWSIPGDLSTEELVAILRRLNPRLRVVFITGYAQKELEGFIFDKKWISYLPKPISYEQLAEDLRVIDPR